MPKTVTGIDIGSQTKVLLKGFWKGNTFHASVPRPVGASQSSHARPSAMSPSKLVTAMARVHAIP